VLITPSLGVPNWSVIYINTAPSIRLRRITAPPCTCVYRQRYHTWDAKVGHQWSIRDKAGVELTVFSIKQGKDKDCTSPRTRRDINLRQPRV
jgi:hypothetical protein